VAGVRCFAAVADCRRYEKEASVEGTSDVAQLFVVALNVFHACFQVAFYRSPNPRFARDGSTLIGIDADPPDVLVPLWPVGPTQKWPAGYSIGQNTLLDFCRRWNP